MTLKTRNIKVDPLEADDPQTPTISVGWRYLAGRVYTHGLSKIFDHVEMS